MFADAATEDFFRARLDHMIDLRHPLVGRRSSSIRSGTQNPSRRRQRHWIRRLGAHESGDNYLDTHRPLAGRGQSELFSDDILGLDSDLYRLSGEDAEALKKEAEQTGGGCLLTLIGLVLIPFTLGLSLLFIMGGLSDIFNGNVIAQPRNKRPQHPPEIKALIDSLIQAPSTDK